MFCKIKLLLLRMLILKIVILSIRIKILNLHYFISKKNYIHMYILRYFFNLILLLFLSKKKRKGIFIK